MAVETAAGSELLEEIFVYDLRTGKRGARPQGMGPPPAPADVEDTRVHAIVLKRNALIGWIGSFERTLDKEPVPGGTADIVETVYQMNKVDDKHSSAPAGQRLTSL